MKIPLQLRHSSAPKEEPARAWFIPGGTAADWLASLLDFGVDLHAVVLLPVPSSKAQRQPLGVVAVLPPGVTPHRIVRARPWQLRIDRVVLPIDAVLWPPLEDSELRELLLRTNSLLRRAAPPEAPSMAPVKMGSALFDPATSRLTRSGKPVKLTGAEAALLQLFAVHAGRPFSRTELCKRLNVALERSIDVQVTRLRRKIEEDPKLPLYLQTVRGVGYMLVPDRG